MDNDRNKRIDKKARKGVRNSALTSAALVGAALVAPVNAPTTTPAVQVGTVAGSKVARTSTYKLTAEQERFFGENLKRRVRERWG